MTFHSEALLRPFPLQTRQIVAPVLPLQTAPTTLREEHTAKEAGGTGRFMRFNPATTWGPEERQRPWWKPLRAIGKKTAFVPAA